MKDVFRSLDHKVVLINLVKVLGDWYHLREAYRQAHGQQEEEGETTIGMMLVNC